MQYLNIVVPKRDKKYKADVLLQLLPKNVRGQIITLKEYTAQREGNTNDDITVFIGKDPGSLSHGKVLFPHESATWGEGSLYFGDNYISNNIRITMMGRSVFIKCHKADAISSVVVKSISEKMMSVFEELGINNQNIVKFGLWDAYSTLFDESIALALESGKALIRKVQHGHAKADVLNTMKKAIDQSVPVDCFYEYSVCVFVKDYLKQFLVDSRDVYVDDKDGMPIGQSDDDVKKN